MKSMLDAVRSLVTPALTSQISAQTSESQASVSKGFDAMIPALLASVANRSDDSGFMNQLIGAATKAATDADLPSPTSIPAQAAVPSSLLGFASPLIDGVARFAGIKSSSASSLFGAAVPLILTYFGRLLRTERLDANGLADRLYRERDTFAAAIPAGLGSIVPGLGRAPAATGHGHYEEPARRVVAAPHRSSSSWVFPLVLAALAIAGLSWWLGRDRTDRVIDSAARNIERPIGTAGRALDLFTTKLPGNISLTIPRGGMEDRLIAYLSSPTPGAGGFSFDRIGFVTGSTALTSQSQEQIRNVAQVLNAYPSARVTVEGFTDNVGTEAANLELSRMRASAVMNALAQSGVSPGRMQAQGYGSRNPVADNRTEDGRARNRRVVLRVTPR